MDLKTTLHFFTFFFSDQPESDSSANLTEKKNKVVQFGPEFDLNIQVGKNEDEWIIDLIIDNM